MIGLIVVHPTRQLAHDELNEGIRSATVDCLQRGNLVYHLLNVGHVHEFHGYSLGIEGVEEIVCGDSFREQLDELARELRKSEVDEAHVCGIYRGGGQCVDGVEYYLSGQGLNVVVLEHLCH